MWVWRKARERALSLLNAPSNATLRRLLTDQGFEHWRGYLFAFAMMGMIAATTALSAWIIGQIINEVFVGRRLAAVWEITAAIVVIYTVKGLATYGQQVILSRVGNSIVADVQRRIFDQMLRMKVAYYSRTHSSEFIARQAFIAQSASTVLNLLITTLSRDALTIVGLVIVMVSQDPLLSVFALMFVPLAIFGVRKIGVRVRKIMASEFQGAMQMMESLQETAQGIRIVKAFTLENFMRAKQDQAITGFQAAANKLARVSSRTSPIMESLGGFAIAAVVLYSGYTVIIRGNSPGSLFSFITSVIMLYEPMKRVARLHVDLSSSLFGVSMLYTFLDEHDYEDEQPQAPALQVTNGKIEFRDVTFGYRPGETVLHGISFVAEAGKTTALVGRSGGGKSTVMNLILRLYQVGSGRFCATDRILRPSASRRCASRSAMSRRRISCSKVRCATTSRWADPARARTRSSPPPKRPMRTISSWASSAAMTRHAVSTACSSPADNVSASPSPALSSRTRRSSFWTKRRQRSIPSPSRRFRRRSALCAKDARRSSSLTGCRRWRKPMKSASSTAAALSSADGTASSWRRGAPIPTSRRRSFRATPPDGFSRRFPNAWRARRPRIAQTSSAG